MASEYVLEGEYLAIDEHGLYVALPDAREIQICLTSQGGLCVMNQALHPIETSTGASMPSSYRIRKELKRIAL